MKKLIAAVSVLFAGILALSVNCLPVTESLYYPMTSPAYRMYDANCPPPPPPTQYGDVIWPCKPVGEAK